MRKTTTLLAMLTLFVSNVMAQQVSVDEAMTRAKTFLMSSTSGRAKAAAKNVSEPTLAYTCKDQAEKNVCYYVFNSGDGFVIVGGDEAAQEILGYSDNGTFDYATAPDNFKWWLSQYQQQISSAISYAESHPSEAKSARAKARRLAASNVSSSRSTVEQLITTQWNQNDPFNSQLPSLGESCTGNYALATGCVATAMAQVMKHYNYPTTGQGTAKSYTISYSGKDITFSADFANTTYDWSHMLDNYSGEHTTAQDQAVGTLMYHCGVSVDMRYGQITNGGSSAYTSKVAEALVDYFNYDKSIRHLQRNYYHDDDWEEMVYNELNHGRPVIYGGQSKSGGHCFICDGYNANNKNFHFNWGWGGTGDGWYAMTGDDALKPTGDGIGGSGTGSAYTGSQEIVTNIKASAGGLETPILYNYNNTLTLNDGSSNVTSYNHTHGTSKTLTLTGKVWNCSRNLTTFKLGIKATDTTTGLTYYFPNSSTTTLAKEGIADQTLTFDAEWLTCNGTYEIKMVGRNVNSTSNDDWYEVGVASTVTIPTVTVTNAAETFTKSDVTAQISATSLYVGQTAQITTGGYDGTPTYSSSNSAVATVSDGVVTTHSAGSARITVTLPETEYYNGTTATFDVTVIAADLIFSQAPYFTNDNNPWEKDCVLHMPLYNGTGAAWTGAVGAAITFVKTDGTGSMGVNLTYSLTNLATGSNDLEIDFSSYKENYLNECINGASTITFTYETNGGSKTYFNFQSITFTYRDKLEHTYTLTSAGIGTLILPFNAAIPTADNDGKAITWKAYECNSMDGSTLVLTEATTLKRNTPYIIEGDAAKYTFTGPNAVDATPALFGNGLLYGTMLQKTDANSYEYSEGDYILQNLTDKDGVAFYRYDSTVDGASGWKATPYRAFLRPGTTSLSCAAIPGITKGNTTGIESATVATKAAGIYTIGGVKLNHFQPGLNIIVDENGNATKVFIKK